MSDKGEQIKLLNEKIIKTCVKCAKTVSPPTGNPVFAVELVSGSYVHADSKPCPASELHKELNRITSQPS